MTSPRQSRDHRPLGPRSGETALGRRVLAGADDQQPSDAVRKQTAHKNHTKGNDPFGIERIIGEIGLRDGFKIKLLTLRFEASRLKRGKCRCQRLFGELTIERQALVFG